MKLSGCPNAVGVGKGASGNPVRIVCEPSEPGKSSIKSLVSMGLVMSDERLWGLVDTVTPEFLFPLSFLELKLMVISGAIGLWPSRVKGRPPLLEGLRCCTTYAPVPVGVGGFPGDGVLSRETDPLLVWYSNVFFFTLEQNFPFRDLSHGKRSSKMER